MLSDRYLMTLWSKAVRSLKGEMCSNPLCGKPAQGTHHIIKRRYRVLRYNVVNGLPLCADCHPIADRNTEFAMAMLDAESREYLAKLGMHTFKDWLMITEQSRDEFMKSEADELKRIIKGE